MFASVNVLIVAGLVLGIWLPINKNLWTSSFAIFMAGMALSTFAFCYWIVDVEGCKNWARPFSIYGLNVIAVYVLAGVLARTLRLTELSADGGGSITLNEWIFRTVFAPLASPINASLLYAACFVMLLYAVAWVMYRRGWFIKI